PTVTYARAAVDRGVCGERVQDRAALRRCPTVPRGGRAHQRRHPAHHGAARRGPAAGGRSRSQRQRARGGRVARHASAPGRLPDSRDEQHDAPYARSRGGGRGALPPGGGNQPGDARLRRGAPGEVAMVRRFSVRPDIGAIIARPQRSIAWFMLRVAAIVLLTTAVGATARADGALSPGALISSTEAGLPMADSVVVRKSERRMYLMRQGEVLRSYKIALGLRPEGHKQFEGDFRTPEGKYRLVRRNPNSEYFLSIEISYPGPEDVARARRMGQRPGGAIMIHGQPNLPRKPRDYYANVDWTEGCIAVSNSDMVEIWLMTPPNTPIEIVP